jgi:hypothetical protein
MKRLIVNYVTDVMMAHLFLGAGIVDIMRKIQSEQEVIRKYK